MDKYNIRGSQQLYVPNGTFPNILFVSNKNNFINCFQIAGSSKIILQWTLITQYQFKICSKQTIIMIQNRRKTLCYFISFNCSIISKIPQLDVIVRTIKMPDKIIELQLRYLRQTIGQKRFENCGMKIQQKILRL